MGNHNMSPSGEPCIERFEKDNRVGCHLHRSWRTANRDWDWLRESPDATACSRPSRGVGGARHAIAHSGSHRPRRNLFPTYMMGDDADGRTSPGRSGVRRQGWPEDASLSSARRRPTAAGRLPLTDFSPVRLLDGPKEVDLGKVFRQQSSGTRLYNQQSIMVHDSSQDPRPPHHTR